MKALILVSTFFCIIVAFSQLGQATRTLLAQPQKKMNKSSTLNQTQQENPTKLVGACSYLVNIYTSCNSPYFAKDQIDIKFVDAYGIEVYFYRLDKVAEFEPCTTEELEFAGKCINKICRLLLTRRGGDGWMPERVTVYDYKHPPITFSYKSVIPDDGHGHGANYCMLV